MSDDATNAGSQSNWLLCGGADGCPQGSRCECGLCTTVCESRTDCGVLHAAATCEAVTELRSACGRDAASTTRVCALSCLVDSDCEDSTASVSCRDGFCLPTQTASAVEDADVPTRDPSVVDDASVLDDAGATGALDVEVVITADNAYGFGYGTATGLRNYFGGVGARLAIDIFGCGPGPEGPETYTVPAASAQPTDNLYIVAWADAATTQGVLGQFRRGASTVYTGSGNWDVCATGVQYDSTSGGPDLPEINTQIALCNGGATDPGTTSAGWVDASGNGVGALAVGEPNDTGRDPVPVPGNEFPLTCGIDGDARWMWFNWDPQTISWPATSPFIWPAGETSASNPDKQFLIFRLSASETL